MVGCPVPPELYSIKTYHPKYTHLSDTLYSRTVNRLQYSRLARYSLRDTPYCAQGLLFAVSSTGCAHKRPPSLLPEGNRDDGLSITFIFSNSLFLAKLIPNSALSFCFFLSRVVFYIKNNTNTSNNFLRKY